MKFMQTRQRRNTGGGGKGEIGMRYEKVNSSCKYEAYYSYFRGVRRHTLIL